MKTYYQILEVHVKASQQEIKWAFKKLAVQHHPDKNPDSPEAEELFKQINEAYQVLSDPYSRARYDLSLTIQVSNAVKQTERSRPPYAYHKYRRKPILWEQVKSKENLRNTLYAFLFTVGIGCLVFGVFEGRNTYYRWKHRRYLEERYLVYQQAVVLKESGNVYASLVKINELGSLDYTYEAEIENFKENLLSFIFRQANSQLKAGNYQEALENYRLLKSHGISYSIIYNRNLANCFWGLELYDSALLVYDQLKDYQLERPDAYLKSAIVYQQKGEKKKALESLELANKACIQEYKDFFGNAYVLMISAKNIPVRHYSIYTQSARLHLALHNYEKASKAASWLMATWKDSLVNYETYALANYEMGNYKEACSTKKWLENKDWIVAQEFACK